MKLKDIIAVIFCFIAVYLIYRWSLNMDEKLAKVGEYSIGSLNYVKNKGSAINTPYIKRSASSGYVSFTFKTIEGEIIEATRAQKAGFGEIPERDFSKGEKFLVIYNPKDPKYYSYLLLRYPVNDSTLSHEEINNLGEKAVEEILSNYND